jgi:hypothetical protein
VLVRRVARQPPTAAAALVSAPASSSPSSVSRSGTRRGPLEQRAHLAVRVLRDAFGEGRGRRDRTPLSVDGEASLLVEDVVGGWQGLAAH